VRVFTHGALSPSNVAPDLALSRSERVAQRQFLISVDAWGFRLMSACGFAQVDQMEIRNEQGL